MIFRLFLRPWTNRLQCSFPNINHLGTQPTTGQATSFLSSRKKIFANSITKVGTLYDAPSLFFYMIVGTSATGPGDPYSCRFTSLSPPPALATAFDMFLLLFYGPSHLYLSSFASCTYTSFYFDRGYCVTLI